MCEWSSLLVYLIGGRLTRLWRYFYENDDISFRSVNVYFSVSNERLAKHEIFASIKVHDHISVHRKVYVYDGDSDETFALKDNFL